MKSGSILHRMVPQIIRVKMQELDFIIGFLLDTYGDLQFTEGKSIISQDKQRTGSMTLTRQNL